MIDIQNIKLALRQPLIDSGIIDTCDIAWSGRDFNPKGKKLWVRETIQPVLDQNITKCIENSELIYVLDVFVPKGSGDDALNQFIQALDDLYNPTEPWMTYNSVEVFVHFTSTQQLLNDDKWQWKAFNVNCHANYIDD